jgi:hypothetical protein
LLHWVRCLEACKIFLSLFNFINFWRCIYFHLNDVLSLIMGLLRFFLREWIKRLLYWSGRFLFLHATSLFRFLSLSSINDDIKVLLMIDTAEWSLDRCGIWSKLHIFNFDIWWLNISGNWRLKLLINELLHLNLSIWHVCGTTVW